MRVAPSNCAWQLKSKLFFNNTLKNKFILFLFAINFFCPKICSCNASAQNDDRHSVSAATRNHYSNNQPSRYFRSEPYGPKTYAFGFEVNDKKTDNRQFRDERRFINGTIEGSYGYVRPDRRLSLTHFIADPKRGYLSQTRTLEQNDSEPSNWRMYFRTDRERNIDQNNTINMRKTPNELEMESNTISVDHIDLEKDLLNPTLTKILKENPPLIVSQEKAKEPELKTFQNIIPNQFPIVPFELPQKVIENLKSNESEKSSEVVNEDKSEEYSNLESSTEFTSSTGKSSRSSIQSTTLAEKINQLQSDWISSFVNQTRTDFLDNRN